jgi:hypothetical protein
LSRRTAWLRHVESLCGEKHEAGPYATRPQHGKQWQLEGHPTVQTSPYLRDGGAKLMTLFRPATGEVRAKGVTSVTNPVLHSWLEGQLLVVLEEEKTAAPSRFTPAE